MKLSSDISAVVTGGASGLGEASARGLAAHGVRVAIFDMNEERGEQVAGEIGGVFCSVNVADEASVDAGLEKARAANGPERVLVNCAGIVIGARTASRNRRNGDVSPHDLGAFTRIIQVNLIGTFHVSSKSAAVMMTLDPVTDDGGRGVIVHTSSVAARDGQTGQVAYSASKGGVAGMTLPMARDLARDGIRVVSIMPGLFHTPMFDMLPEEAQAALGASVPFPTRLGRPEEYALMVRQICENDMLNGECIRLDGAVRLAPR